MAVDYSKIMLTLDGSEFSKQAAPHAFALARRFNSKLVLYTVIDNSHNPRNLPLLEDDIARLESGIDRHLRAWAERAEHEMRALADTAVDLTADQIEIAVVAYNNPSDAIVEFAKTEDVDLIVICTHGRGGLKRQLYGSVADLVLRHAPCPVMMVRAAT